jgi:hypothetical protein
MVSRFPLSGFVFHFLVTVPARGSSLSASEKLEQWTSLPSASRTALSKYLSNDWTFPADEVNRTVLALDPVFLGVVTDRCADPGEAP